MSADDDSPSGKKAGSYTVGYGRPPVSTRFRPGNRAAAGRHRKQPTPHDILTKVMMEDVTVTQNGTKRKMPAYQAMIHNLAQKALNGDPRAQDRLMKHWDRFDFRPPNYTPEQRDYRAELRDKIEQMAQDMKNKKKKD